VSFVGNTKQLGISWIQGEFTAVFVRGNAKPVVWQAEDEVADIEAFSQVMKEAVQVLNAKKADVSIVYESNELSHPFIQLPPMNTKDLPLFLEHRVEEGKTEGVSMRYSYRKSLEHRNKEGVLLHLIHQGVVDGMIKICENLNLFPVKLLPLSEIMEQEICRFHVQDDEVILMVAAFNNLMEVLVSRGDGKILFLRDLNYDKSSGDFERLKTEIKRSMLYARQQFQVAVDYIAIIGEDSAGIASSMDGAFDIPIQVSEEGISPYFWAEEVIKLSTAVETNLFPILYQYKRNGQRMRHWVMGVVSTVCIVIFVFAFVLEYQAWQKHHEPVVVNHELEALKLQKNRIQQDILELKSIDRSIVVFQDKLITPVPAWFLESVSKIMPKGLVLTSSEMMRGNHGWQFTLIGSLKLKASLGPEKLTLFEENIKALPLQMVIDKSWKESWFESIRQGGMEHKNTPFLIQGHIL